MMRVRGLLFYITATGIMLSLSTSSAFALFSDVSPTHEHYQAISYLENKGIIEGYEDGTFKPDQLVNRAEAIKIILYPIFETYDEVTEPPFPDVTLDLWYAQFVNTAKIIGAVSGDGVTGNFEGIRNVNLVELLKMLILANEVDVSEYETQDTAIYNDVTDLFAWYIKYLYYASSTNLINGDIQNYIYPGKSLTRGEVAEISFRLIRNIAGGDLQILLSQSEAQMIRVLQFLQSNDVDNAEIAAQAAVDYSAQALALSPDEPIVQSANKISLAFDKLVKGYRAGIEQDYTNAEIFAQEAWQLANDAVNIDNSVETLANNIKSISGDMADEARANL